MNTDTNNTNNEVARLKEEIKKLKSAAQEVVDRWETPLWKDAEPTASVIYRLRNALAPAPEEPATEESSVVEPAPEWRELGQGEVIQEGDEWSACYYKAWEPAEPIWWGKPAKIAKSSRFRTRRPLPVQEQEQPYCSRCKYNHAFPCEGSLAGVPLEDELSAIEDGNPWIDPTKNILICLRYLRDEIQKLKEAKP